MEKELTQLEKDMLILEQLNNKNFFINEPKISLYSRTKTYDFSDNYIVFDLETTGYSPIDNEILEISAIKFDNNKLVDTFNCLIKPLNTIPSKITKLTGITNEIVACAQNIEDIFPQFLTFIKDYTLVEYNGSFDLAFVEHYINKFNLNMINNPNIDVLYLARNYIDGTENYKLETLKKFFNLDYSSHRALADCYTTNYIYQYCKNHTPITSKPDKSKKTNYKKYSIPFNKDIIDKYKKSFINNSFLENKNVVITGEMENFNRNELIQLLTLAKANVCNSVTKKTDLLIEGSSNTLTSKKKRALELISNGQELEIITENILLQKLEKGA